MDFFLVCIGIFAIVAGGILLIISDEAVECALSGVLMGFGLILFIIGSLDNPDEVYKLTITDTKTKETTYEIATEIEERESYLKYTDEDGNEHYILMEDKEILKEELE